MQAFEKELVIANNCHTCREHRHALPSRGKHILKICRAGINSHLLSLLSRNYHKRQECRLLHVCKRLLHACKMIASFSAQWYDDGVTMVSAVRNCVQPTFL